MRDVDDVVADLRPRVRLARAKQRVAYAANVHALPPELLVNQPAHKFRCRPTGSDGEAAKHRTSMGGESLKSCPASRGKIGQDTRVNHDFPRPSPGCRQTLLSECDAV